MFVVKGVALAGAADGFDEPLVVVAHEGVVLLDHQAGVRADGR